MKLVVWISVVGLFQPWVVAADKEIRAAVQQAITRLAEQPNYSWIASTRISERGAASQGPLIGQAERNGYTYFKLSLGENTMEAAFHGRNSAIKTDEGWQSSIELDGDREWIARRLSAFEPPTIEVAGLLARVAWLRHEKSGAYYADLKTDDARQLVSQRSRTADATGVRAKGWVRFYVAGGSLTRYEYHLEGKIPGPNRTSIGINRTTTVEIKEVGTTQVNVPEEARNKLQ